MKLFILCALIFSSVSAISFVWLLADEYAFNNRLKYSTKGNVTISILILLLVLVILTFSYKFVGLL